MARDELDAKLARLGSRVQSRADETRQELASIGCLELAEELKSRFGAKLAYLRTPSIELGRDVGPGCPWTVYYPPQVKHEYHTEGSQPMGTVPGRGVRVLPAKRKKKSANRSPSLEQRWHGGQGAERASGDDSALPLAPPSTSTRAV